jgi:hypothetical protein
MLAAAAAAAAFHSFSKTITATLYTLQYKRTLPDASVFAIQQHLLCKQWTDLVTEAFHVMWQVQGTTSASVRP